MKTLVMKFGGSTLQSPACYAKVSEIICAKRSQFDRVAVVISAMQGMTDQLIDLAHQVTDAPPKREYDMLVSVGERISISLLAMALSERGCDAVSFTGSQSGIITSSDHSDARIVDVRPHRLLDCLNQGKVAIVAGFQGVSLDKEITTLGRGGSDTTAVALGVALQAEVVEFIKDVDGIYSADPKICKGAEQIPSMSFDQALESLDQVCPVLHPRAIKLAKANGLALKVLSVNTIGTPLESSTTIEDSSIFSCESSMYESCNL